MAHRREIFQQQSILSKVAEAEHLSLGSLAYLQVPDAMVRLVKTQQET